MKKYILSLFVALIAGVSSQAWGQLKQPPPINPTIPNIWTMLPSMDTARHSVATFVIGSKIYVVMGDTTSWYFRGRVVAATWELDTVTKTWTRKANFPGKLRIGAVGFSIGTKGYVGGGRNYNKPDSLNNSIALNNDTFKIVQTGPTVWARFDTTLTYTNAKGDSLLSDFWEYDQAGNSWSKKADIPGTVSGRAYGVGFAMGGKGYVGLGYDNTLITGSLGNVTSTVIGPYIDSIVYRPSTGKFDTVFQAIVKLEIDSVFTDKIVYLNDMWEYNPGSNTWTQKANFPGQKRAYSSAFTLYTKAGVGLGTGDSIPSAMYDDFYAYTPATDSWKRMLDFPASKRYGAGAFGLGFLGYIVGGNDGLDRRDFYEYNDISETWDRLPDLPDSARSLGASGISSRMGFFGVGAGVKNSYKNMFKWIVDTNRVSITSLPTGPFCGGEKVTVSYKTPTGIVFNSGNKFIVQISDTSGSFFYPTDCSDTTSTAGNGTFTFTIPATTLASPNYRFRIVSTNPKLTGTPTTVNTEVKQLPSINTHPINTSTCLQADAKLTVAAVGTNLTYQWRKNGSNISDGAKYSGTTTDTLTIMSADLSDGGNFDVIVSGTCSPSATSFQAALTVQNIAPPNITLQPKSDTICEGNSKTFTVGITGGTALNYRWIKGKDTLRNSPFIIGSTTSSLTINPTRLRDSGWYRCLVFENCGSRTFSDSFKLSFYDNTDIVTQPNNVDTIESIDIGFKVIAKGHNLNYQWYKGTTQLSNGTKYTGVNTDTMTIKNLILNDVGFYQCKVWGDCGDTVWSLLGLLELDPFPVITQHPDSVSQCEKSTVYFSVKVDGADFFYQWRRNGSPIFNGGKFTGTDERTLIITDIAKTDEGLYDCEVSTGPYTKVISNPARLTVNLIPDTPKVNAFGAGQLTCSVGGGKEYRWYIDNIHAPQFTTQTITVTQVGDYRVRVTSDKNCVSALSEPYFWFPTGVIDVNAGTIKLYPNPASNSVEVELPENVTSGSVRVLDLLGKTVMENKFNNGDSYQLNISTLPQGVYIVTVSSENDTYVGRLVKQ